MPDWGDEQARLPYFYADGDAVLCPPCAFEILKLEQAAAERITARYTASRSYLCGKCHVLIGPVNDEEAAAA